MDAVEEMDIELNGNLFFSPQNEPPSHSAVCEVLIRTRKKCPRLPHLPPTFPFLLKPILPHCMLFLVDRGNHGEGIKSVKVLLFSVHQIFFRTPFQILGRYSGKKKTLKQP